MSQTLDESEESAAPAARAPDGDQQKPLQTILEQEIELALDELERPARGLFLSGISAGLDIGFSVAAVSVVMSLAAADISALSLRLLVAAAYPIGFIFVIFGRSELYTEHTTLAFLPIMARRSSVKQLLRLWGLVYCANLIGTAVFAGLLAAVGPAHGMFDAAKLAAHVDELFAHSWWVALLSAMLAGWLMGLLSWLVTAARSTTAEFYFVALVTFVIGLAELPHCIVGNAELLTSIFATGSPGISAYLRALLLATVGNTIGGVVFVSVIKYAHATRIRHRVYPPNDRAADHMRRMRR